MSEKCGQKNEITRSYAPDGGAGCIMFLTGYFCHPLRETSGMVSARTLGNRRLRSKLSDGIGFGSKPIAAPGHRFGGISTGPPI